MTMHGFDDPRFAILDDAVCHQRCLDNWELKQEFVSYANENFGVGLALTHGGQVIYRPEIVARSKDFLVIAVVALLGLPSLAINRLIGRTDVSVAMFLIVPVAVLSLSICAILMGVPAWVCIATWVGLSIGSLASIWYRTDNGG
ncbi:hypothetical protein K227x_22800 [Rubripirellula lacrimiformis]|uniref:Uncharacterized protein n=2 Tax=Rubripirellula lacrimiformis TaxID=1930273 RepID=A0A517N9T2_9BACT|nr:hypothetical protein K227x_22800 [Rubripirellula lacrimiformis]